MTQNEPFAASPLENQREKQLKSASFVCKMTKKRRVESAGIRITLESRATLKLELPVHIPDLFRLADKPGVDGGLSNPRKFHRHSSVK